MTAADVVALPLWLVVAGAVLALWSVFDRMLVPSIRWFVRRRLNRVIDDLNARLQFQIPRFASTRRQGLIDRLTYDRKSWKRSTGRLRRRGLPEMS